MFPAEESSVNRRQRQWVGKLVPASAHKHARARTHTSALCKDPGQGIR